METSSDDLAYVTVCSVCSAEFPALRSVSHDTGTAHIRQTCPNGHKDYLFLKHDSTEQVAQRIKIWWSDYHWSKPETPVAESELVAWIGFGFLGRMEGMSDEALEAQKSYQDQNRDLFRRAMTALAESSDYFVIDGDGKLLPAGSRWIGLKEHWNRLFQEKVAEWSTDIEALENLDEFPSLIDAASSLGEGLGVPFERAEELHANVRTALEKREAKVKAEAKANRPWMVRNPLEATLVLVTAFAQLVFWVGLIAVVVNISRHVPETISWLTSIQPSSESAMTAFNTMPPDVSLSLKLILIGLLLAAVFVIYVAVQVPLAYFLVGAGLLLSFVVYEKFWLLIVGLVTLGIGAFVFWYWAEQQAATNQYLADQEEE